MNPAYRSTSSTIRPLRCKSGMGGVWRLTLGDGPNESGFQLHLVH